jgi:hypothetical protein
MRTKHWQARERRFLGFIALTAVLIALYLGQALRFATHLEGGHRVIDTQALVRRIEAGELRDREAAWYHPSTAQETRPP